MFIGTHELFKIGIGPSSSHTMGPMIAALDFIQRAEIITQAAKTQTKILTLQCTLKGSLAFTGKGHATHYAVTLGLHGHTPENLIDQNPQALAQQLWNHDHIPLQNTQILFTPPNDIIFDYGDPLPEHPNGMVFTLSDGDQVILSETYFSIGGGFIHTLDEIHALSAPLKISTQKDHPYPFPTADVMLQMSKDSNLSIAAMKRANEQNYGSKKALNTSLDAIWQAMQRCVENGLRHEGVLPGEIKLQRRAKAMHKSLLQNPNHSSLNEWLCAYAMAVNEENAAGHMVVTAPTNGAAGVIPAVLYYWMHHQQGKQSHVYDFLLTAAAIGGLIKHNSSISGAEVGCQGEVGSAAAMAAAGLCAVLGGSPQQVENAAEIALEHHLGMTCDPVKGLVQVPCIERNGFGAIKAYTAASLAMHGSGEHFVSLDQCVTTMKQTGFEMSAKYKETSLGGLAVNITEC